MTKKISCIGILTAGGDCPGLNAAIRAVVKAAVTHGIDVIGFKDGFRGLIENRSVHLESETVSGILTVGGTILGTRRDKPHRFSLGNGKVMDMTDMVINNYSRNHLDCLICLGGGGTQKNALRLMQKGLNIITLPKTIDNDVAETSVTFGFDTALNIAAEAIDRLHTTAESHKRIMLVEIMGHNAGWLTLGAGIAGGADVVLIPELPYTLDAIAAALLERSRKGKKFSIIAVAEGAVSQEEAQLKEELTQKLAKLEEKDDAESPRHRKKYNELRVQLSQLPPPNVAVRLAPHLQKMTGMEARVTSLGHLQRGGVPTPTDRLLATLMGTAAVETIQQGRFGVMIALQNERCIAIPLERVAGRRKLVPLDHPQILTARLVGTSFGTA